MSNKYTYLGIWLLGVASLSSCNNEDFIADKTISGELRTYIVSAESEIPGENQQSRANVKEDGKSFFWNTGDELTIWNGKNGFTFKAVNSYDDKAYLKKVEFTGNAELEDGQTVWGVYPKNETASSFDDVLTFTLPEEQEQTTSAPSLQHTMFMYSQGTVSGNAINNMSFSHLTGIMHFTLTNKRNRDIKIEYISVKAGSDVFPYQVIVSNDGNITYTGEKNEIKLNINQTVNNAEVFNGYISVLPTENMNADTELTFSVKISGDESETELKKGKVSQLYGSDTPFAQDGYKYIAGKRYGISKMLLPPEGDLGYTEDGNNIYYVYSVNGFTTLMEDNAVTSNKDTKITLTQNLDFGQSAFSSVPSFKGTLDGGNLKISNLKLEKNSDGKVGLFISNEGTIKNLQLENITIENTDASVIGLFAAENKGTISGCSINGSNITLNCPDTGSNAGFVVGNNFGNETVIEDVVVSNSIFTIEKGKTNLGVIAGQNGNRNAATIRGCSVIQDVTIECKNGLTNTSAIGGMVGWNCNGKVIGSSSAATIKSNNAANFGGIVGANDNGGTVQGAYCCGTMDITFSGSRVGGIVGNNGSNVTACYSSVTLNNPNGKVGGLIGENNGNISKCYIINCNKAVGQGDGNNSEVLDNSNSLIEKLETLNSEMTSIGYKFVKNESSENEPLILVKDNK